ncbi:hypothetical protein ABZW18_31540 [Streptomyces sp. NPDC004647]|uniref:hypothetical protein n=1 Tax=Streptomyces sp. NPDC004647 TaxID=3154671 RepID=UPI0033A94958
MTRINPSEASTGPLLYAALERRGLKPEKTSGYLRVYATGGIGSVWITARPWDGPACFDIPVATLAFVTAHWWSDRSSEASEQVYNSAGQPVNLRYAATRLAEAVAMWLGIDPDGAQHAPKAPCEWDLAAETSTDSKKLLCKSPGRVYQWRTTDSRQTPVYRCTRHQ